MDALISQYNSLLLGKDDPMNADELNFLGDEFLSQFQTTGDDEHLARAITAYKHAADCLPMDDQRRGTFQSDLAIGYRARFERYGKLDDLQEAITRMEIAVASTGEDDANFPWCLSILGAALSLRFECTGDMDNISEAIQYQKRAIQLAPDGHAGLSGWYNNLGNSYLRRFKRLGKLDDLSDAIRDQQLAVELTPDGHADLSSSLNNLGISLLCRFQWTGDLGDLSEAIKNHKIAIQITSSGHTLLPAHLNNLGFAYSRRFGHTGDMDDISEAIRNQQRAIELTPDGHADLPSWLNNLGISYSRRFRSTGDLDDISKAIQNQKSAIQLAPEGNDNLPAYLNDLGTSFSCQFDHTGDLGVISEAIKNQQHAIQLVPDGNPNIPDWLTNLGNSFWGRFRGAGDLSDVSEAIRNQERAVQLTPDGHSSLPARLDNLGISYSHRFQCTGDLVDISVAIRNQQHAIRLTPDGHADLPALLSNLGNSFLLRYERTGNLDDVSEAIKSQERAVELTPDGRAELPARLGNLGTSFSCRFPHTGDLNDISEAIRIQQLAIQLTPDGHFDLPTRLNNLGLSFLRRFNSTKNLDDLSEAIRSQDSAVRFTQDGHSRLPSRLNNLGTLFFHRFQCTDNLDDISEAIQIQQRAVNITPDGHADLPGWLNNLGDSFFHRFKATNAHEFFLLAISHYRRSATSPTGSSDHRLHAASKWAALAASHPSLSSAASEQLAAHARIIQLMSLVSGLENTIRVRHQTLLNSSQLSIAASATALSLGHSDKALEWLVQGRCIVWNQINQLRTPLDELRSHDPALAEEFFILSRRLEIDGLRTDSRGRREELSIDDKISLEDEAGMHIRRAKDWERLLSTIRNIPEFEDFLQPRKCANIMRRLPREGNVIIINVHRDRCDALALKAGAEEPIHIPLPRFSYQEAERLATGLRSYLLSIGVRSRLGVPLDDDDLPVSHSNLPEVLDVLWVDVVSPILEELGFFDVRVDQKELSRIWWCPTGPLAFLPIHAAGIYDKGNAVPKQTLSEFAVSSYIPTVHVLDASNSVKTHNELLMVSVTQCLTPGMSIIPFAKRETEKIAKQLEGRQLSSSTMTLGDEKATVNRVLELMDQFPCIHLACHASQNMTDPLESSIYLYDGPLKLSEIMKKDLKNSDFAFLSACQTSKGDKNLSEEVVHLTSGMLAAGYRSVVGTMWSIYDVHGPDLAGIFYESLLENSMTDGGPKIDGSGAAQALHNATQRLRENTSGSPDSFLAWVPYIHMGI